MQRFKVCMLGAPGVGKTSLVQRFIEGRFDERYLKTLGVKIDRKTVMTASGPVSLIVWDIYGDEDELPPNRRHLRGMAGSLIVIDGTRPATAAVAAAIQTKNATERPTVPYVLVVNKADLFDESLDVAQLVREHAPELADGALAIIRTSALDGSNVEDVFSRLGAALIL